MATSFLTEMNLEIKQCRRRKDDITVVSSVIKLSQSVSTSLSISPSFSLLVSRGLLLMVYYTNLIRTES